MAAYADYKMLRVELRGNGVCVATIDGDHYSKINLMTMGLFAELDKFSKQVEEDAAVRVVVMRSRSPKFWIAHFDVENMIATNISKPAKKYDKVRGIQQVSERFRLMPKPTIAEVAGRLGGGGCELAMGFDMRFGVIGRTFISQQEAGISALAGGSGTVNWPEIAGRGRAMEVLLGCIDVDACTAEKWGWLNRAFPTPETCSAYVDWIADRMAALSQDSLANIKKSVNYSAAHPHQRDDALCEEQYLLQELLRKPETMLRMKAFIAKGGQTWQVESEPDALMTSKL